MRFAEECQLVIRGLRGGVSQVALARSLRFDSNVLYAWEAGLRAPKTTDVFKVAVRRGVDLEHAIAQLCKPDRISLPARARSFEPSLVGQILQWIGRGRAVQTWASEARCNRGALALWLKGKGEPRFPVFLALLWAAQPRRYLDWLSQFCPIESIPWRRAEWARLTALREIATQAPQCEGILRALEVRPDSADAIAVRLGLSPEVAQEGITALRRARLITKRKEVWHLRMVDWVDTSTLAPAQLRRPKSYWAKAGLARLEAGLPGLYSYNVVCISTDGLRQLQEVHVEYFNKIRAIVRASTPAEQVAVINMQLFTLDGLAPALEP